MIFLIPPSSRELIDIAESKYAMVVAVSKRARVLSEKKKDDENYRLSSMVTEALNDITSYKVKITGIEHESTGKEVS